MPILYTAVASQNWVWFPCHALQNNSSRYQIDSASKTAHYGKAGMEMEMEMEMETGIENWNGALAW